MFKQGQQQEHTEEEIQVTTYVGLGVGEEKGSWALPSPLALLPLCEQPPGCPLMRCPEAVYAAVAAAAGLV